MRHGTDQGNLGAHTPGQVGDLLVAIQREGIQQLIGIIVVPAGIEGMHEITEFSDGHPVGNITLF